MTAGLAVNVRQGSTLAVDEGPANGRNRRVSAFRPERGKGRPSACRRSQRSADDKCSECETEPPASGLGFCGLQRFGLMADGGERRGAVATLGDQPLDQLSARGPGAGSFCCGSVRQSTMFPPAG